MNSPSPKTSIMGIISVNCCHDVLTETESREKNVIFIYAVEDLYCNSDSNYPVMKTDAVFIILDKIKMSSKIVLVIIW